MSIHHYEKQHRDISASNKEPFGSNGSSHPQPCHATRGAQAYQGAVPDGQLRSSVMHRQHGYSVVNYLIPIVVLAIALAIGIKLAAGIATPGRIVGAAAPGDGADPSRFLLNALLVPAIDDDVFPVRWVDPRPAARCGPGTSIRVNSRPLVPGAAVPETAFELEWQADGCHPFGAQGPRFDGRVKLTVFREDSGFSAIVEPSDLRITSVQNEITFVQHGSVYMPQPIEPDATNGPRLACADPGALPCP